MQLSRKAIDEFKKIYRDENGVELSDKEAMEKAIRLLLMVKASYKPIPSK